MPAKQTRLQEIQQEMGKPGFYENRERANLLIGELKSLGAIIEPIQDLLKKVGDLKVLLELGKESGDAEIVAELEGESARFGRQLERIETMSLLSKPTDAKNCYFTIQAGAGGTESCDWAEMLLRMYLRYFEKAGYQVEEISRREGEEAGIQNTQLYVKGLYASGYLSCEMGVHRLVRISPFDSAKRRHTSFASVDVLPEFDDIEIEIDWDKDVREDVYRSGGAGGQHVNKTSSAVRLTHLPTGAVVACQNERSQHQNRALARKMLMSKLYRLEESKRNADLAKLYGEKGEIAFGNQIRSYVLYPYQMVKDHRTDVQTSDTEGVLNGEIQNFIDAELRHRAGAESAKAKSLPPPHRPLHPPQRLLQQRPRAAEVQPDKAGPGKVLAVGQPHAGVFEEPCRIGQIQRPRVDPRQVRRLHVGHRQARHLIDRLLHAVAVAPQVVQQGQVPVVAVAVRRQRSGQAHHVDRREHVSRAAAEALAEVGVGDDRVRAAQPGQVERLAGGAKGDRPASRVLVQHRGRHVRCVSVEHQAGVDFIGADDHIMPAADPGQRRKLLAAVGSADRIVRIAQQEQPGPRCDGAFDRVEVELPAALPHLHGYGDKVAAGGLVDVQEVRVDRRGGHHLVAVVTDRAAGGRHGRNDARQPDDPVRFDRPAVPGS